MQSLNELYQAKASEKKYSPLKFAWDKFKELGVVPSSPEGNASPESAAARVANPMHARHQEYQALVTKRSQAKAAVLSFPKAATPAKPECVSMAGTLLSQGLHESAPNKIEDFGRSAEAGVAFLLGA